MVHCEVKIREKENNPPTILEVEARSLKDALEMLVGRIVEKYGEIEIITPEDPRFH